MLRDVSLLYGIEYIPAGIFQDNGRFRYESDKTYAADLLNKIQYQSSVTSSSHTRDIYDDAIPYMSTDVYAYKLTPRYTGYVIINKIREPPMQKIICQKPEFKTISEKYNNRYLLHITASLCERDYQNMHDMTETLAQEVNSFQPIDTYQNDKPTIEEMCSLPRQYTAKHNAVTEQISDIISQTTKSITDIDTSIAIYAQLQRIIAEQLTTYKELHTQEDTIFYETLRTYFECKYKKNNIITQSKMHRSSLNTLNNTEWRNKIKKLELEVHKHPKRNKRTPFLDMAPYFVTVDTLKKVAAIKVEELRENMTGLILNNTEAITAISINQKEIAKAYDTLRNEITTINNISKLNEFAIATMAAETDIKSACYRLHNTVQLALLKLANAMALALQGHVSPYILSEKELDNIVTAHSKKHIMLANKLHQVEVKLTKTETEYLFALSIPILDKNTYKLYRIQQIPIFQEDTVLTIKPDNKYIGISVDTTSYVSINDIEYTQCVAKPVCKVSSPIITINEMTGCTAYSYRSLKTKCPAVTLPKETKPFFATYGNTTLFSTPKEYIVNIVCPNANSKVINDPTIGTKILGNTGSFTLNPNCFVETQDNRRIVAQAKPDFSQDLGVATLSQALKYMPKPMIPIEIPPERDTRVHLPEIKLQTVEHMTFTDIVKNAYKPENMTSHVLRDVLLVFAFLISFALLTCISPRVRAWFKACCFVSNPVKYWTHYKKYTVNGFNIANRFKTPSFFDKHTPNIFKEKHKRDKSKQQRKAVFRQKFEIDEIINKNRAAVEAQCKVITAPIIKNVEPIKVETTNKQQTFPLQSPRITDVIKPTYKVEWEDTNL
jgi:hypothetical protein